MSPREKLFTALRKAVKYHDSGYSRLAEINFDANEMLHLMDQLREALDEFDAYDPVSSGAKSRS